MGAGEPPQGDVTVGIDIGTTSVKAVAAAGDGAVLARARVPHPVLVPEPGAFEHDVDLAWRDGVLAALGTVAGAIEGPVAAVNVAAMVPSLGAVDAEGRAVGPGLLYGDHRGGAEGAGPGDSGELLAFLAWQAAAAPGAAGYWPAQAVANHALTGRGAIDTTTAMTAHPLFDFRDWDAALAAGAGATTAQLPDLVPGAEPAGRVREGLPAAGALVGGGTIDALAEQLVGGAAEPGDVQVLCGTTLITWGVLAEPREVPGLWTIPHTVAGRSLIGGPSNAGGLFLEAVRGWLGPVADADVAAVGPGDLPVWLPYVRGERTPLHRRDLRASLSGLATHHTAAHLLRAAYEASGFVVRHHLDLAREAGLAPTRILATGGGTQVPVWMRALADTTGLPVHVAAVPEGAALGSAFVARWVAGLEPAMTGAARWAATGRAVDPDPAWASAAAERYAAFRSGTRSAASPP
ncbi:MAG TPA: FGGY-family carbohydrate kinase [Acidimicrobiales bacterium]|nr:FGGY-family carbohydrate kinase [Acidimicrobiales bacterium]